MPATPPKKSQPRELSNEVRMVIAFVLMGLILVATPWVYRRLGLTPPEDKKTAASTAAKKPDVASPTAGGAPMKQATLPAAESTSAAPADTNAVSAASA